MEFKDYYATLGVERTATQDEIKRSYRKLARKYHPDVSKEPDAESRFKEVAEAHEALIDPERRAAYDDLALQHAQAKASGRGFEPPPGWDRGYEFSGRGGEPDGAHDAEFSAFFESLFGRGRTRPGRTAPQQSADHHAQIDISLEDAYRGARHSISLRRPVVDASGQVVMAERQVDVNIPKGVRPGQHLRLAGMGNPGQGSGAAGDLYLEIGFHPHERFRVDGADVWFDLPVAPWEAALGATVTAATPEGDVSLNIPADSATGRKLRLKGRGLPGKVPGDLYAVLHIALPLADTTAAREAYAAMAKAFTDYNPRKETQA